MSTPKEWPSFGVITGINENDFETAADRAPRYDFEVTLSIDEGSAPLFLAGEHQAVVVVSEDRLKMTVKVKAGAAATNTGKP